MLGKASMVFIKGAVVWLFLREGSPFGTDMKFWDRDWECAPHVRVLEFVRFYFSQPEVKEGRPRRRSPANQSTPTKVASSPPVAAA